MTSQKSITIPNALSWDAIKQLYPDQWVLLAEPILEGTKVLQGLVLSAHPDKRVASIEGSERREDYKKFTLVYTGQSQPTRRIGILQTKPIKKG
jgi:hypothetical protein